MPLRFMLLGLALSGAALALMGWRALRLRRPFIVPTMLLLPSAIVLGAAEPLSQIAPTIGRLEDWRKLTPGDLVPLLFVLGAVAFFAFWKLRGSRGYAIFGVTESALYNAVRATLKALGIDHKITNNVVAIANSDAKFQLSFTNWQGIGRISTKSIADAPLLRDVVIAMGACFDSEAVVLSRGHCIKYVAWGLVLATVCGGTELLIAGVF